MLRPRMESASSSAQGSSCTPAGTALSLAVCVESRPEPPAEAGTLWQRHARLACGECCLTGESGRDIRMVCGDANLPEVMASISLKVVSICIHSCSASPIIDNKRFTRR
eukprot:scaffold10910_cov75-Phaeocystis_antarctica.AAC.2